MTWSLHLFDVTTGAVREELPSVPFTWSHSVRDSRMDGSAAGAGASQFSSLSFSWAALRAALPGGDLNDLLMPGKRGVLAAFQGRAVVAGIIGARTDTLAGTMFPVLPLSDLLGKRYAVVEAEDLAATWFGYSRHTLGTVAKRLVEHAMSKPGGALPIILPPEEALPGMADDPAYRRTYRGFDIANLDIASLLEDLTDVEPGGTDIAFRPEFVSDNRMAWRMQVGTHSDPYIGQDRVHSWEVGGPDGSAGDFEQTVSAVYRADRVYGAGAGQDEGTATYRAQDLTLTALGWPLVEVVVADSSWDGERTGQWEDAAAATRQRKAELDQAKDALREGERRVKTRESEAKAAHREVASATGTTGGGDWVMVRNTQPPVKDRNDGVTWVDTSLVPPVAKVWSGDANAWVASTEDGVTEATEALMAALALLAQAQSDLPGLQAAVPAAEAALTAAEEHEDVVALEQGRAIVAQHTRAAVHPWPMAQWELTVRADGDPALGDFWPGDLAEVAVRDFPTIPDGIYPVRILSMSGDSGRDVRLTFGVVDARY